MIHPTGINLSLRKPWKLQITSISFEKATRKFSPTLLYKILPFKQDIQFFITNSRYIFFLPPLQTHYISFITYTFQPISSSLILTNYRSLSLFIPDARGNIKKGFPDHKNPSSNQDSEFD